jgi:glycerol-3-phosphate dehydrogenase
MAFDTGGIAMNEEVDVVVIGGGATGAGTLWDLTLRGIHAVLLEQNEPGYGTSGRNHGCLHSGGRYLVKDPNLALECYRENQVLRHVAGPAIEDTGGFFAHVRGDDDEYVRKWVENARRIELPVEEVPAAEARAMEPLLSSEVDRVFSVPDAAIDPFDLIYMNLQAAVKKGASFMTETRVKELLIGDGRVQGVLAEDIRTGEVHEIRCRAVINAAGPWVGRVAGLAGISLELTYGKGSLLVYATRLVHRQINRFRKPSDGDVLMPGKTVCLFGTTDIHIKTPDDTRTAPEEVTSLLEMERQIFPDLPDLRVARTITGVRPLYTPGAAGVTERDANRGHVVINHAQQDGLAGFFTIMGGKLTTYRLMAEQVVDEVARELGVTTPCMTAETPLPGLSIGRAENFLQEKAICECEQVTETDLQEAALFLDKVRPGAIRRMTRLGLGPCQGMLCIWRGALCLYRKGFLSRKECLNFIDESLDERWKGIRSVLWGDQIRQAELGRGVYLGIYGPEGH